MILNLYRSKCQQVKDKQACRANCICRQNKDNFFSTRFFFTSNDDSTRQQGQGGDRLLFNPTTSTHSQTFRHLFATLHVRWLSHIFNRNTCIGQIATQWNLPPYWITIRLIGMMLIFVSLLDDLILGFCYRNLTQATSGLKVALNITFELQTNWLTKGASHPKYGFTIVTRILNELWI